MPDLVAESINRAPAADAGIGYQWIEIDVGTSAGGGAGALLIASTNPNQVAANTATITNVTGAGMNIDTWREWNAVYTLAWGGTGASTITNYSMKYGGWPFNSATSAASTSLNMANHLAWNVWNDRFEQIQAAGTRAAEIQRYSRRKLSEKELLEALEQEKKAREAAEKRAAEAKAAEKRAEDLLRLCLTPQQIEDLDKKRCFYVEVEGKGEKKERYRIDRGSHGNVKQIDDRGSIIRQFCIQPSGVPNGDVLLTQKLWLEASEETREEFWATANITTLMREKEVPHTVPRKERRRYAEAHGLLH
ncbi:MAG TPA: hypothetical protein VFA98_06455 [Thermoanaerobaculia bacterium]|jgi:hypothetical protein|nr:hypothetical protein [Thermoanaerobaculia bacterium]